MSTLYTRIARLAAEVPELRSHLIPILLREAAVAPEVVLYNGKKYHMIWSGKTKYGERARLEFLDGTKDFWVDLSKVTRDWQPLPAGRDPRVPTNMWPKRGPCPVCHRTHRYIPCGYPGCTPQYCDECDGGGRLCRT